MATGGGFTMITMTRGREPVHENGDSPVLVANRGRGRELLGALLEEDEMKEKSLFLWWNETKERGKVSLRLNEMKRREKKRNHSLMNEREEAGYGFGHMVM